MKLRGESTSPIAVVSPFESPYSLWTAVSGIVQIACVRIDDINFSLTDSPDFLP